MQFLKSILEKKHRFCCRSNASLNPTCSSICSYYVTVFCFFCLLLFLFYVFFAIDYCYCLFFFFFEILRSTSQKRTSAFILLIDEFISSIHLISQIACFLIEIFIGYFASPRPTLGHYQGDILTHLMLITAFYQFRPDDRLVTGLGP